MKHFFSRILALFSIGTHFVHHDLGMYGEIKLPEGWEQELPTKSGFYAQEEMKRSPEERERRRPLWDADLNDREITYFFTKDAHHTFGGRVVPNALRVTLFNSEKVRPSIPEYLKAIAKKGLFHDGVGGLADRKFTDLGNGLWINVSKAQRPGTWGMINYEDRWFLLDLPQKNVRILLSTYSDYMSEKESLTLIQSLKEVLLVKNVSTYFSGPVPKYQPFYLSGPETSFTSDAEIVSYDWSNQVIVFNRSPGGVGKFKVNLGDKVLYEAEIVNPISARLIKQPVAYAATVDGKPGLILRSTHDFINGLKVPDLSQPEWKTMASEELRSHFEVSGKLIEKSDPELLKKILP